MTAFIYCRGGWHDRFEIPEIELRAPRDVARYHSTVRRSLEGRLRKLAEIANDLACIDEIARVMAGPIGDPRNLYLQTCFSAQAWCIIAHSTKRSHGDVANLRNAPGERGQGAHSTPTGAGPSLPLTPWTSPARTGLSEPRGPFSARRPIWAASPAHDLIRQRSGTWANRAVAMTLRT